MLEFVPLAAALALALKLLDFVKYITAGDINAIATQGASWVSGVLVVFLLAATDFSAGILIGDVPLETLNAASLILLGLSLGSSGSVLYDFKKAIDRTDSAVTPSLLPGVSNTRRGAPGEFIDVPLT